MAWKIHAARRGEPPLMAATGYPEDLRDLVETALADLRFSPAARTAGLEEAMRYSLLAGGKRVRPVLALATACPPTPCGGWTPTPCAPQSRPPTNASARTSRSSPAMAFSPRRSAS